MNDVDQTLENKIYARRVFLVTFLFFFTFIAVDIFFVTTALRTHTGVVTDSAYEKGLAYNTILDQAQAQRARGWAPALNVQAGRITFSVADAKGVPISGLSVRAEFKRMTYDKDDFSVPLSEEKPGFYTADLKTELKGQWVIRALVFQGEANIFQMSRTMVLK